MLGSATPTRIRLRPDLHDVRHRRPAVHVRRRLHHQRRRHRLHLEPDDGTTYVNGNVAIEPGGNRIFQTIWDGGGTDTYDLSDYSTNLSVDLNPGYHSIFSEAQLAYLGGGPNNGNARGNVFNALQYNGDARSLIENAIGGSGNDNIIGNAANNMLYGNDGNDDLTGFAGNDTLLGGNGKDWIDGHIGADQMYGGDGNDIYYVDSLGDTGIEDTKDAIGGVDLVFAYVAHNLGFGVENLTIISGDAVNGHGNELANAIQGASGQNELSATPATTRSAATPATTSSSAATATTGWSAVRDRTSCSAARAPTSSTSTS